MLRTTADLNDETTTDSGREVTILENIIPYNINRLTYKMNRLLERDLNAQGLSISAWRVLAVLDGTSTATVNDLAVFAMIEQSTLSRLLRRMEEKSLIVITPSPDDGRVRDIRLTDTGRETYRRLEAITLRHVRRITNGLSPADLKRLLGYVRHMRKNVGA